MKASEDNNTHHSAAVFINCYLDNLVRNTMWNMDRLRGRRGDGYLKLESIYY